MVVEWMVHVEQSMWNDGGMDGSYETVHMEWWWSPWTPSSSPWTPSPIPWTPLPIPYSPYAFHME